MDVRTRVANAEEQSLELHRTFSHLEHRIREFIELQTSLVDLHRQLSDLAKELGDVRLELDHVHRYLPTIARKEELERFERKLDAIPFEKLAVRPQSMARLRGEQK